MKHQKLLFCQPLTVVYVCHSALVKITKKACLCSSPSWEFPVVKLFHLDGNFLSLLSKLAFLALSLKPVNCEPGCSCQSNGALLQRARWRRYRERCELIGSHQNGKKKHLPLSELFKCCTHTHAHKYHIDYLTAALWLSIVYLSCFATRK